MTALKETRLNPEFAWTRSAAYALLANCLRYPDERLLNELVGPERWMQFNHSIAQHMPSLATPVGDIENRLIKTRTCSQRGIEGLQELYVELFGHAVRGQCPAYELEYGRKEIIQQASELADIQGFYDAFGLQMSATPPERADHISTECEFMSALAAKEHYAIEHDDDDAAALIGNAQRSFLQDHLGRWCMAFSTRLQDADADGFYGKVAGFAQALVSWDCDRLEVACGPAFMELCELDPESDTGIECGVEASCPGVDGPHAGSQRQFVQLGLHQR